MKGLVALVVLLVAIGLGLFLQRLIVDDPAWQHTLTINGSSVTLHRQPTKSGMFHIYGRDHIDFARAVGYVHAQDRLVQMELQRLAALGRLSEALPSSNQTVAIDTYFRFLNFERDAARLLPKLSNQAKLFLDAYCDGVNHFLAEHSNPWDLPLEFMLVGHRPAPWQPFHTLITSKLMAFVGLAETQGEIEKLIMHSIRAGLPLDALRAIFTTQLKDIDPEVMQSVREAEIRVPVVPEAKFAPYIASFKASNNWAVGPSRTKSGHAIQCYDPHLDISRLPPVWYEFAFHYQNPAKRYIFGASVPGMPAIFFGRNNDVSFGLTYGFMDQIDYFFERVKDGKYMREVETNGSNGEKVVKEEWREFHLRKEIIKQNGGPDIELVFHENENGVIERHKYQGPLEDGLHLTMKWSWGEMEESDVACFFPPPSDIKTVAEFHEMARYAPISANWINADRQGNIGYQQSGRSPQRHPSVNSALPLLGWRATHRWNGTVNPSQLLQILNPAEGYLATANDDLQNPASGVPKVINYHMGFYRKARIDDLIEGKSKDKPSNAQSSVKSSAVPKLDAEDMKRFQLDVYSKQAEYYIELLRPILTKRAKSCGACQTLLDWDCRFSTDSIGASVYTSFRTALLADLFGERVFGLEAWQHMVHESGITLVFQWYFDRVLLWDIFQREDIKTSFFDFAEDNPSVFHLWNQYFADEDKNDEKARSGEESAKRRRGRFLELAVERHLVPLDMSLIEPYAAQHSITMKNIFFNGQLPSLTGFDVGPIPLEGSGSTINQGSLFRQNGQEQSFCPSYRFITDMSQDWAYTALPGGISGRRFSGLYLNPGFFEGHYKTVEGIKPMH